MKILSVSGDGEAKIYRDDFVYVFGKAGWDYGGEQEIGEAIIDPDPIGIEIVVHQINEHQGQTNDAINTLIKVIGDLNLFDGGGPRKNPQVPEKQVPEKELEFRIGHKPRP